MPEDTALHEAVRYDDLEEAEALLREGHFDVNELGMFQWSCLHDAASNGLIEMLRLLLRYGADPNVTDSLKGFTALHYASEMDDLEAAESLIEAGARLDVLSKEGLTPLDTAVGLTRDLLLRKAPMMLKEEPERMKENHNLLDSISKLSVESMDNSNSLSSQSASAHSINNVGSAELSFEYNSRKEYLKVRVWRLSDLLMPPARHSPIAAIFLRGKIDIGRRHCLKSDTETVRAYPDSTSTDSLLTEDGEFAPNEAVYRFQEPIHFQNVTPDVVAERSLQLTLCMRTKRPTKVFAVSALEMPLREAVLRLTKRSYALRPHPDAESKMPGKARVFGNASMLSKLRVPSDTRSTHSHPSLRLERLQPPTTRPRSSSDSDLRVVRCHEPGSDTVSIELGDAEAETETQIAIAMPLNTVELVGHRGEAEEEQDRELGRETSLISVTVHRPPEDKRCVSPSVALNVPLMEEDEEEENLTEVVSGVDNPTFIGSVEYLMPPLSCTPRLTSDLRVHSSGRSNRKKEEEEAVEMQSFSNLV